MDNNVVDWVKVVEEALCNKLGRSFNLQGNVTDEELGMNKEQRANLKHLYVKNAESGEIFSVHSTSSNERFILCKLTEHNVPHLITPIAWCNRPNECGEFVIFPFIKVVSLAELAPNSFTDLQWLEGFKQVIEFFYETDPDLLGKDRIKLYLPNLTEEQILYEPATTNWYVTDFSYSEISCWSRVNDHEDDYELIEEIRVWSPFEGFPRDSNLNSTKEFGKIISMFVSRIKSDGLREKLEKIKTRDRNSWLRTVQNELRNLSL